MNLVGGIFGVIFSVLLLVSGVVGFVTCFTFGQNRCVMMPHSSICVPVFSLFIMQYVYLSASVCVCV